MSLSSYIVKKETRWEWSSKTEPNPDSNKANNQSSVR